MTSTVSAILGENSEFEGYPASAAKDPQWSYDIAMGLGRRFIPGEKAESSVVGAVSGTRTHTPFREGDFKSPVSALSPPRPK